MTAQKFFYLQKNQKKSISLLKFNKLLSTDEFSKPLQLSPRLVVFLEAEIGAWLAAKAAKTLGLYLAHSGMDCAPATGNSND